MDFILFNGKISDIRDFNANEVFLKTGISVKEEMWFDNGEIRYFEAHMENLASILKYFNRPSAFDLQKKIELSRLLKRLINKNKAFMGGWLSVIFYFETEFPDYFASVRTCPTRTLPFQTSGKLGTISPFIKFSGNQLASFAFFSDNLWKIERFRLYGTKIEEALFLNEKGMVAEAIGSNLFCISKNILLTPSIETGCVIDPVRETVIRAAQNLGFLIIESEEILPGKLPEMEEIFTVSEGSGFKWIMGIETKRYVKTKTFHIWEQLNKIWFPDIS